MSGHTAFSTRLKFALLAATILAAAAPEPARAQETDARFWIQDRARYAPRQRYREAPVLMRRTQPPRRIAPARLTPPPGLGDPAAPLEGATPHTAEPAAPAQPGAEASAPAAPVPAPAVDAPKPPQFNVAVLGDSLGQLLGQGLQEAFAQRADIGLLRKARENTGLVRDDYFDWPKAVRDLLASGEKIDLAIMILGSNDRQQIRDGQGYLELYSPRWIELYTARVAAIAEAFRERNIRLVWVGLPIMKSASMASGATTVNEIYRQQAAKGGAAFVDIWEAFADERGQYSDFGPDLNGHVVRLRSGDGVHFTKAGARKLAHFVEGGIRNLIIETKPAIEPTVARVDPALAAPVAPDAATARPEAVSPPSPPPKPALGPVLSLTAQSASPGAELARPSASVALPAPPPDAARPGRADDFAWPQK